MFDRLKFATELANELNKTNTQYLTSLMVENAVASAVNGVVCALENKLADVVSVTNSTQYSVKSYKDAMIPKIMSSEEEEREDTGYIIERRISGVTNPDGAALDVFSDILKDLKNNENTNHERNGTKKTKVVLLGHTQDDEYWYFRCTEADYNFSVPDSAVAKNFSSRSKNYMLFTGNISSFIGYDETGKEIYKWIHPNSSTYTRCLMKKYSLSDKDSFFFKIKKSTYSRPSSEELMSMIFVSN